MFRSKAAGSTIGRFPWEGLSLSFIGCDTNNSRLTFHRGNWLPPSRSRQTKVESHFPLAAGWKRLFTFYFSAMGPGIEVKRCIYRGLYFEATFTSAGVYRLPFRSLADPFPLCGHFYGNEIHRVGRADSSLRSSSTV